MLCLLIEERKYLQEIFKGYGAAIGPTLAFCLGVGAIFIKNMIDSYLSIKRVRSEFYKLSKLVKESSPPNTFHPQKSESGLHAGQASNLTNIARFYNRLLGVAPLIEHLEEDIYKFGSTTEIRTFNNLKWWFSIALREVEAIREKNNVDHQDIMNINQYYESMLEALNNPNQLYDYIEKT